MPASMSTIATTKRGDSIGPRSGATNCSLGLSLDTVLLLVTVFAPATSRRGSRATLVRVTETPEGGPQRKRGIWRIGTPLVVLLSGALFAVSADNSEGTDLRPGRYSDLASLVDAEADDYDELE